MLRVPPGFGGLSVGASLFIGLRLLIYYTREPGPFYLDPKNKPGREHEPHYDEKEQEQ
jgi:hypothetical protein